MDRCNKILSNGTEIGFPKILQFTYIKAGNPSLEVLFVMCEKSEEMTSAMRLINDIKEHTLYSKVDLHPTAMGYKINCSYFSRLGVSII